MLRILVSALLLSLSLAPRSGHTQVVVELYTSQACPVCAPADAFFAEMAQREDVIGLSLHVDYWDYLGWTDPFADPRHGERQRGFARQAGRRSIYTPQIIVNGVTDVVATDSMKVASAIMTHQKSPLPGLVTLSRSGTSVTVDLAPMTSPNAAPYVVNVFYVAPHRSARIARGENAGKTLEHANVVEDWGVLAEWDGASAYSAQFEAQDGLTAVVVVQEGAYGPVVGAARVE